MAQPSERKKANLVVSTVVFIVGDIEAAIHWYEHLGFKAHRFPPGFAILYRGDVQIFLQQQDGYSRPDDPGARERGAWNVYIETDDVASLFEEYSHLPTVSVTTGLCRQEYGQTEFQVTDPNGYVLVFAQPTDE